MPLVKTLAHMLTLITYVNINTSCVDVACIYDILIFYDYPYIIWIAWIHSFLCILLLLEFAQFSATPDHPMRRKQVPIAPEHSANMGTKWKKRIWMFLFHQVYWGRLKFFMHLYAAFANMIFWGKKEHSHTYIYIFVYIYICICVYSFLYI